MVTMENLYDVAIIGGGPAGATAGIYCGRAELSTVIIEKMAPGGQMATTAEIENYPGFPKGADGVTLAMDMAAQAKRFGANMLYKNIISLSEENNYKVLTTDKGEKIIATMWHPERETEFQKTDMDLVRSLFGKETN